MVTSVERRPLGVADRRPAREPAVDPHRGALERGPRVPALRYVDDQQHFVVLDDCSPHIHLRRRITAIEAEELPYRLVLGQRRLRLHGQPHQVFHAGAVRGHVQGNGFALGGLAIRARMIGNAAIRDECGIWQANLHRLEPDVAICCIDGRVLAADGAPAKSRIPQIPHTPGNATRSPRGSPTTSTRCFARKRLQRGCLFVDTPLLNMVRSSGFEER